MLTAGGTSASPATSHGLVEPRARVILDGIMGNAHCTQLIALP